MRLKRKAKYKVSIGIGLSVTLMLGMTNIKTDEENKVADYTSNQIEAEEFTSDTVYSVGSVSKMFTTVAVMQLVEQGKINLDEPITTYLPEFKMADERYKLITTRMLLNHSSGLMGSTYSNNMLYEDNDTRAHDTLIQKLRTQRLKADPGLYATYCNDGFVLAEIIVERVSGRSFTEYLHANIFEPLDMKSSGTSIDYLNHESQVSTYFDSSTLFAPEYCTVIGTGGVLSTAEELCKFGATFMSSHNGLLKDSSLEEMRLPASTQCSYGYIEDGSLDQYGLGWDSVEAYPFNEYGITALVKGGDVVQQHGMLMVLPEEDISVSVLSSGGNSSFNALLAQELATIALEEKGIYLDQAVMQDPIDEEAPVSIPKSYLSYAGTYANATDIYKVTFPNETTMQIENCDAEITRTQTYHYTNQDKFVADDHQYINDEGIVNPSSLQTGKTTLSFKTEVDGKQYLCIDTILSYAEIGESRMIDLFAEKLESNALEASVQKAWEERSGKKYYLVSEKYSSSFWTMSPVVKLKLSTAESGYISPKGQLKTAKIIDQNKAKAFVTLTGGMGRDLSDLTMIKKGGIEYLYAENPSFYYIEENKIPNLDLSQSELIIEEAAAKWYHIGDDTAKQTVYLNPSEEMAVYIYDEYDECIYSSYMKNRGNKVILPREGKLLIVGEVGSSLKLEVY